MAEQIHVFAGEKGNTRNAILEVLRRAPLGPTLCLGDWYLARAEGAQEGRTLPREIVSLPWEHWHFPTWHDKLKLTFKAPFYGVEDYLIGAAQEEMFLKRAVRQYDTLILSQPVRPNPRFWQSVGQFKQVFIETTRFKDISDTLPEAEVTVLDLDALAFEFTHGELGASFGQGHYSYSRGEFSVGVRRGVLN